MGQISRELMYSNGLYFGEFSEIRHVQRSHPTRPGTCSQKTKASRVTTACKGCADRKIKCDSSEPTCGSCKKRGEDCFRPLQRRPREYEQMVLKGQLGASEPVRSNDIAPPLEHLRWDETVRANFPRLDLSGFRNQQSEPTLQLPFSASLSNTVPDIPPASQETFRGTPLKSQLPTQPNKHTIQPQCPGGLYWGGSSQESFFTFEVGMQMENHKNQQTCEDYQSVWPNPSYMHDAIGYSPRPAKGAEYGLWTLVDQQNPCDTSSSTDDLRITQLMQTLQATPTPYPAHNNGNSKRPRRPRNKDKRFTCDYKGCKKTYNRAEHLTRHQLNRKCPLFF